MNKIENVKPGQTFRMLGVAFECVRQTGKVIDQPNRNQWGRLTGGTHKALKVAVRTNRYHRGMSPVHYVAFPVGCSVVIED